MSPSPPRTLPHFTRQRIISGSPAERVLAVAGDVDGDGRQELVVAARLPTPWLRWYERVEGGLWHAHLIDDGFGTIEAGGVLADIAGNGRLDFVAGQDWQGADLFWWENPEDEMRPWQRRLIFRAPANQLHDQVVADLDCDGRAEVYFWNQGSATLFAALMPDDPRSAPWPEVIPITLDVKEEGLAVGDLDGDGRLELIAGQSWYRSVGRGRWERHEYARGFTSPKVIAADLDGDGRNEIILAEGDASQAGRQYGRVACFRSGGDIGALWQAELLHERLLDPHSLIAADFDGDGQVALFVGEMGNPKGNNPHTPAQRIYRWREGRFIEQIIDRGIGTHNSCNINIDGRIGIIGKPFQVLKTDFPRLPGVDDLYLWLAS